MLQVVKLGCVFIVFGVVVDGIFFGISIYDLYKDFIVDNVDFWKIVDDFVFVVFVGVGVVFGGQ